MQLSAVGLVRAVLLLVELGEQLGSHLKQHDSFLVILLLKVNASFVHGVLKLDFQGFAVISLG